MSSRYLSCEALRPCQLRERARIPLAYVPFGTLEWHGEHLPVGLDGLKVYHLSLRAAARTGGVVLPPLYWGIGTLTQYPFTHSLTQPTFEALCHEIFHELVRNGFTVVLAVTGHHPIDQILTMKHCAASCSEATGARVLALPEFEVAFDSGEIISDHAARWETSQLMELVPKLVDMSALDPALDVPPLGVYGEDPRTSASPELGQWACEQVVAGVVRIVQRLRAGEAADNYSQYDRWIELTMKIPLEGVSSSLRALPEGAGFEFAVWNPDRRSRYISRQVSLTVDGQVIAPEQVTLINPTEKTSRSAPSLDTYHGFYIRRKQTAVIRVEGRRLETGSHALCWEYESAGRLQQKVDLGGETG